MHTVHLAFKVECSFDINKPYVYNVVCRSCPEEVFFMMEKAKTCVNKYFSNGPKAAALIAAVLMLILIAVFFNMRKSVVVSIDGNDKKITTFKNTYAQALKDNGIKPGPKDKVTPSLNSRIHDNGKISIKKAVKLKINVDGKKLVVDSAEDTVYNMLKTEKIKLSNLDIVSPKRDSKLKNGLNVVVTRVKIKDIKENRPIDFETVIKKDSNMQNGSQKVLQEGQNGEKQTVTRITYNDGKQVSEKVISEAVKKQPVNKVIAMGETPMSFSRGGSIPYQKSIKMRATAYTADYSSTGKAPGDEGFGITATGTVARRNSSVSSVAVDPRVIPLGTKLYVEGYGYAIAEDTGGAIKGNRIDLFFNSSSEANDWGVKWVNVYVAE